MLFCEYLPHCGVLYRRLWNTGIVDEVRAAQCVTLRSSGVYLSRLSSRASCNNEDETMKRLLYILALGFMIVWLAAVSAHGPKIARGNASQAIDAAFRDGRFLARLDAQNGRRRRIASGGWSTNRDRALFITGYQQGYREFSEAHSGQLMEPNAAELAGYRDGMLDGARHRGASQPLQINTTDNYRNAGHEYLELNSDPEKYKHDYRLAYSNGYQEGYYSQPEQEESKTASDPLGHL